MVLCLLFLAGSLQAQIIILPPDNANDTSNRKPLGCFYGYERTHLLYSSAEIGATGYITQVGFYLNHKLDPAEVTPVVIKMQTTANTSISSSIYGASSASATTVYTGNLTSDMLPDSGWVTLSLDNPFNYTGNNLDVFVETNFGGGGGESYAAKQFRQSLTPSFNCEYWEDDNEPPTDYGIVTLARPNILLSFEAACTGVPPVPGNILSTLNPVCANEPFTLSLENIFTGAGLSFQWQSSPESSVWVDVAVTASPSLDLTQSDSTFYRCIVSCTATGATDTSSELQIMMNPFYYCYCASYAFDDADTKIDTVVIGTIFAASDPFACESYTDNTFMSTAINPGQPVSIKIANGSCSGEFFPATVAIYIDYNHNTTFDSDELVASHDSIAWFNDIPELTFFVPLTALSGLTGMRIILQDGATILSSCGEYTFGETEDYLVNISSVSACTGAPDAGIAVSTQTSVCPNQPFTLSLAEYPSNSGITYQWQFLIGAAYANIAGATNATYTVNSITAPTEYRVNVTCTSAGGATTSSSSILVNISPFYFCYCESYATHPEDTKIDSVIVGSIVAGTDSSTCETYTNNTFLSTDLAQGENVTIRVRNGSCTSEADAATLAVYIDINRDANYDANELAYSYSSTTGINTIPDGFFTVPGIAQLGLTGMRIILAELDSVQVPCGTYLWGETEDYVVNIISSLACVAPPTPGTAVASTISICSPQNVTLNLIGNSTGIGQTYQWEQSTDGINWTPIPGETSPTASVLTSSTTYYRALVTCSSNTQTSASVTVEMKPTPVGNSIVDPIIITTLPYTNVGDNLPSNCWSNDYTDISAQPSPDVFYFLEIDAIGYLNISTCQSSSMNTWLHLLDVNGNHLVSNDNQGPLCSNDFASLIYAVNVQPASFYIVVEGHNTDTGSYQLDVSVTPDSITQVGQLDGDQAEFNIYPNPAAETFSIHLNDLLAPNGQITMKIYNMLSQVRQEKTLMMVQGRVSEEFHLLPSISDGMYIIEITYGRSRLQKVLMIQH
ncbi:MAG: T9SS type A sorting domain-containing protein [Chitinophagales bacterium]|nr:T9SS type A sorting domain-containing protein [Chitinophagales bacterium]